MLAVMKPTKYDSDFNDIVYTLAIGNAHTQWINEPDLSDVVLPYLHIM